uniref:HAT C-terminal dimerisation domain-containing protein n=1 Tax=Nothobranchius furzeri TaxID=105023 RepID=A0A8C6NWY1_NOTFU
PCNTGRAMCKNLFSSFRISTLIFPPHHDETKCLVENQDAVMSMLSEVTEDRAAAVDICTEASGLLVMLRRHHFFEIGKFLSKVLGSLKSASSMLQSHSVDLCCASEVVSASLQALKQMRDEEIETLTSTPAPAAKRQRKASSLLTGSIVMSTVGHVEDSTTPSQALKRALLNILDIVIVEMETRFSKSNLDLMKALNCLQPQSPSFLDPDMLSPLQKMTGSDSEKLSNEILVAKLMLEKEFKKTDDDNCVEFVDLSTDCKYLHGYKKAFPQLHRMYVTSLVTGISAALCKSSFSTLSRVLTPFCHTMIHERKRNVVILAREEKRLMQPQ